MSNFKIGRNCCFTKWKIDHDILKKAEEDINVKYMIYQEEVSPKTKKDHLQGYIEFKKVMTLKQIKTFFNDDKIHIEKRLGNRQQAREYCMKEETRKEGSIPQEIGDFAKTGQGARNDLYDITNGILLGTITKEKLMENNPNYYLRYYKGFEKYFELYHKRQVNIYETNFYKDKKLRKWQKEVLEKLENQTDRKILWVVDPQGNNGKSFLAKYIERQCKGLYLENAKKADLAKAYNYESYVCFDYTKSNETFINYSVLESLKNGRLFSPKYESFTKRFIPPKLIVFSNFYPDKSQLVSDRWQIYNVPQKGILEYNFIDEM